MRISLLFLLLASLAQSLPHLQPATGGDEDPGQASPPLKLLVPAYFYPAGDGLKDWERMLAASAQVPVVAVVNPASGPGKMADPNYTMILRKAKITKTTLLGYVTTSYCKRPVKDVQADVDQWLRLYPGVHGIFFDEQASGAAHVAYQANLHRYVHANKLKLVVTNPGTVCAEEFFAKKAVDASCLFEGPKPFTDAPFPDWAGKYPGSVAALSYKVPSADVMRQCLRFARAQRLAYVYVTDADGANPWNRLPSYWDAEVVAARVK